MNHIVKTQMVLLLLFSTACMGENIYKQMFKKLSPYLVVLSNNAETDSILLKSTTVDTKIVGTIADVKMRQVYVNICDSTLDAIYISNFEKNTWIYSTTISTPNNTIRRKIVEKSTAKHLPHSTLDINDYTPSDLVIDIYDIAPNDSIVVELHYIEPLESSDGEYVVVYPKVMMPKYFDIQERKFIHSKTAPYYKYLPSHNFNYNLTIHSVTPIEDLKCHTHAIDEKYSTPCSAHIAINKTNDINILKDLIISYSLIGVNINTGIMLYEGTDENFFLFATQPAEDTDTSNTETMFPDIKFECPDFEIYDTISLAIPDAKSTLPIVICGKYKGKPSGTITVTSKVGNKNYTHNLNLSGSTSQSHNKAIEYLWAAERIKQLKNQSTTTETANEIKQLGLKHGFETKYTSTAIETERIVENDGATQTIKDTALQPEITTFIIRERLIPLIERVPPMIDYKNRIDKKDTNIYHEVELLKTPVFKGGKEALNKFITQNLRYPQQAMESKIEGFVFVSFVVEKNGKISNIRVQKDIGGGCGDEAVRIIKAMPRWKPGINWVQKFVRTKTKIRIKFSLNN
jgi:TonB family protein